MNEPAGVNPETSSLKRVSPIVGISFFFWWTLFAAVLVAISNNNEWESYLDFSTATAEKLAAFRISGRVYVVITSILNGGLVAVALTMILAYFRHGTPLFSQPGHWLLIGNTISDLTHYIVYCVFEFSETLGISLLWYYFSAAIGIGISALFIRGAIRTEEKGWKIYLALSCCTTIVNAILNMIYGSWLYDDLAALAGTIVESLNLVVWALVAMLVGLLSLDFATRIRRDWVHYVAVIGYILQILIGMIWSWIFFTFFA